MQATCMLPCRTEELVLHAYLHFLPPTESLHVSKPTWWLESRFHFSFSNYW